MPEEVHREMIGHMDSTVDVLRSNLVKIQTELTREDSVDQVIAVQKRQESSK